MKKIDLSGFTLAQKPLEGCSLKGKHQSRKLELKDFPIGEVALTGVETSNFNYFNTSQSRPQDISVRVQELVDRSNPTPPKPRNVLQGLSKTNVYARQVNDLANLAMNELPFCVANKNVYTLRDSIWEMLTPPDLVLTLRREFSNREIVAYLNEKIARDILSSLQNTPSLQRTRDDLLNPPYLLPCQDALFDLRTEEIVQNPADYFFTSALNITAYEIGRGPHYYTDCLVDSISGGISRF